MTDWLELTVAGASAIALMVVPGLIVAWALRLRGFARIMVAVPASFALTGLSTVVAPPLGIGWNIIVPFALAAVFAVAIVLLRKPLGVITPSKSHPRWIVAFLSGLGIAAVVAGFTLFGAMPRVDAVSQTYDAVFHLNAVQFILHSGSASPFDMNMTAPESSAIYPTLWHAFVALTVQVSGASIPLATNAVLFSTIGIVWPIGIMALGRATAGSNSRTTLISGVLSVALPAMPFALAGFGVLYPTLLSIALLPFVFVALMQLFGTARSRNADLLTAFPRWLLFIGTLAAAMLAQPSALHVTLMFVGPLVLFRVIRVIRSQGGARSTVLALLSAIGFATIAGAIWYLGRSGLNPWSGKHDPLTALFDGLGSTPHLEGNNWPITVLLLLGLAVGVLLERVRPLVLSYVVFLGMYVAADGFSGGRIRDALLTPWYSDPWRISALLPLVILPLATLGASTFVGVCYPSVRRWIRVMRLQSQKITSIVTYGILLSFLTAAVLGAGMNPMRDYLAKQYSDDEKAALLSQDERELLERLGTSLPLNATLLTNPWNGGSLAFAIAGTDVLLPHMGGQYDPDIEILAAGIARGEPEACGIAERLQVNYLLDFGPRLVMDNEWSQEQNENLQHIGELQDPPALTEIDHEGSAVLYRISGCAG